ncbi:MAG: hypothetical protein E7589_00045 [Ruminococcaceae bacterium]|nr:hypothetical protein [Oscillospiraceae bacterium]
MDEVLGNLVVGYVIVGVIVIALYVGLSVVVANMAYERGRNAGLFVLLGLLVSPIVAMVILLALGDENKGGGSGNYQRKATLKATVTCPYCGSTVSREYSFCARCGNKIPDSSDSVENSVEKWKNFNKTAKCPFCGVALSNGSSVCRNCGKETPKGFVKQTAQTELQTVKTENQPKQAPKELFKCGRCQTVINRSVCPWCGYDNNK